ncbi:MAG: MFS transporter [Chloroflexi bacterium]|nr:MAG: MFS transporter [Chloroflexota bacterium]TMG63864.1 MAG: MFS transporter [Chloroflexota bacterium]
MLRTFAYGYLTVVIAIYLARLGLDTIQVGLVLSAAILGSALMTVLWALVADRYGRRRTVATMATLMIAGGMIFAFGSTFPLLLLGAFTGTISATSSEVGAFLTVEQAILPQTAPPERRTWLFSIYAFVANIAQAVGSLFAGSVAALAALGLAGADAYRPLFVLYAVIGLLNLVIFLSLSDKVEAARVEGERRFFGVHRSAGTVAKLGALFGLDAFAGGLVVQSLVAYWFFVRWGFDPGALAVLFFFVNILSGVSLLAAGWLAGRIGLINTMVFTHLPSNLLLVLVPLMPTAGLAAALFLARMSISQMDVPTRQSYTMAVVDPDERTATAGLTNVARSTASAVAPAVTGWAFSVAALSLPFFVAGALKVVYDVLIFLSFRGLRPPEERHVGEVREVPS